MDVTTPEQAKIAEDAGAAAVIFACIGIPRHKKGAGFCAVANGGIFYLNEVANLHPVADMAVRADIRERPNGGFVADFGFDCRRGLEFHAIAKFWYLSVWNWGSISQSSPISVLPSSTQPGKITVSIPILTSLPI